MSTVTLKVLKLNDEAVMPTFGSAGAAAFDISTCEGAKDIPPGQSVAFKTGLSVEVPEGHVLLVFSRSGHGFKSGIRLVNSVGVIDADYRGELGVKLHNDSNSAYRVGDKERIAQGIIMPIPMVQMLEVSELSSTERGANGFGSTGK